MPRALTGKEKCAQCQRLLEKGKTAVITYGIRKVSVDDIAKSAGMAKGTFYQHFESKEKYLYALMEKIHHEIFMQAERIIFSVASGESEGDLRAGEVEGDLRAGEGEGDLRAGEGEDGLRAGEGEDGLRAGEGEDGLRAGEGADGLRASARSFLQKLFYMPEMAFLIQNEQDIIALFEAVPNQELQSFKQMEAGLFEGILRLGNIDTKRVKPGVVHNYIHTLFLMMGSDLLTEDCLAETVELITDSLVSYIFGGAV